MRSFLLWSVSSVFALIAVAQNAARADEPVSFVKQIAPILVKRCVGCHGAEKPKGGFSLHNLEALNKGISGEQVIVPGKPEESWLYETLLPEAESRMPYKEEPLADDQQKLIAQWIKEGAKFDVESPTDLFAKLVNKKPANIPPQIYPAPMAITSLAFSPDGKQLATGGYHEILIWEVESGKLIRRLGGLPERTYGIRYSPNGWWIATASGTPAQSGIVRLWDAADGSPIRELAESNDSIFALAFSPDSRWLASGGADRAIRVWDMATGQQKLTIEDHADWVLDVGFSPDGKRLASASRDKTSKVFEVANGEAVVTFSGHSEPVYAVSFARDGKSIVSAGADKVLRVWNPNDSAKKIRDIGGHGSTVFQLNFTPDGSQIVTCSADKTARSFNPGDGKQIRSLSGHKDWVYSATVDAAGKNAATGSWDGEVKIWNLADGKEIRSFVAMPTEANSKDVPVLGVPADRTVAQAGK